LLFASAYTHHTTYVDGNEAGVDRTVHASVLTIVGRVMLTFRPSSYNVDDRSIDKFTRKTLPNCWHYVIKKSS